MQAPSVSMPLVLIPGFMLDESLWDPVVAALDPALPVVRASLAQGATIAEMAEAILAQAPPQFIAVGFSLGGYVARALVEAAPTRVQGLVLIGSSLREDTPAQRSAKLSAIKALANTQFQGLSRKTIGHTLHPDTPNREQLIDHLQAMSGALGFACFERQSLLARAHITRRPITLPCLIIASDADPLRGMDETRELQAAIVHAESHILKGVGHMLPLEAPATVAQLLTQWHARLSQ